MSLSFFFFFLSRLVQEECTYKTRVIGAAAERRSSYCYTCVLILLYMCPDTATCHDTTICVSSYCCICVVSYYHMCPHTAIHVFLYYYVCAHTTTNVSSYCYKCVLMLLYMRPHTAIYVSSNHTCVIILLDVSSYYYT